MRKAGSSNPGIVLIAFSGGLDSTYMAYKLLSEGREICPVYFEIQNINTSKSFTEKQQAEKIVSMLRKEFSNRIFELSTVVIPKAKTQWEAWLRGVKSYVTPNPLLSEVAIGWNQSDIDDEGDVQEFKSRILQFQSELRGNLKPIFPVFNLNKIEINQLLPQKYRDEIFFCEVPFYNKSSGQWVATSCSRCIPCTLQRILGIYAPMTYQLPVQPSDRDARQNNQEHYDNIKWMTHYENGVLPLHLQKKSVAA